MLQNPENYGKKKSCERLRTLSECENEAVATTARDIAHEKLLQRCFCKGFISFVVFRKNVTILHFSRRNRELR